MAGPFTHGRYFFEREQFGAQLSHPRYLTRHRAYTMYPGVGEVVGHVANPYEDVAVEVRSPRRGIIIGRTTLPIVNMGDALLNIGWSAEFADHASPEREALDEPFDEDEVVE